MNALIITLLITNAVVVFGAGKVIVTEIGKLNRKLDEALLQSEIKKDNSRKQAEKIIQEVQDLRDKLLVSNASVKDTIRQVVKGELHDEIIKLAFTPLTVRQMVGK